MMAKRKPSVTITASIIGAIAVVLGAILTPFIQDQLDHPITPTSTLAPTTMPTQTVTVTAASTETPIVLTPTWIDRQGSVLVLDNQVLIHIDKINYGFNDAVDISVTIGTETQRFQYVKPGERVVFQYLGMDYFVTIMQIIGVQTQISVERSIITK